MVYRSIARVTFTFGSVFLVLLSGCGSKAKPQTATVTLGYVESSPAAYVRIESGLTIRVYDVVYDVNKFRVDGYKETITYPGGESVELAFTVDYGADDLTISYKTSVNGETKEGPSRETFEKTQADITDALAVAPNLYNGDLPKFAIRLPCPAQSENVEYGSEIHTLADGSKFQSRQIVRHTLSCENPQKTYTLEYEDYRYDEQVSGLAGLTVKLSIAP
jgi:hypothetical protein